MDDRTGEVIEGYTLLAKLGRGGGGSVYRAKAPRGGQVAVKLIDEALARNADMRARFEREARALNGLDHPHLIRMLDFGIEQTRPYLVMELCQGVPLDKLLSQRPLPPTAAFDLGIGIVAGLAHAHAHGVLHRDIKPENIFVAILNGGVLHPKLLDFGLARFTDQERWGAHHTLTAEGQVIGTPTYMPPEQGFGARVDARGDVYAVSVVLYELLAHRPPFIDESRAAVIRAHALKPFPPITELRPEVVLQRELEEVFAIGLAKKPANRFADATEMLRAMQLVPEPAARLK